MIAIDALQILCNIAREAGRRVMEVYATPFEALLKSDESPVTLADIESDRVIQDGLNRHFPGVFIQSEENCNGPPEFAAAFFLVDPLDGTKEFIRRSDEFTVNIAMVHDGVAVAGVVYAPALDELFFAAKGLGAWKECDGSVVLLHLPSCRVQEAKPLRVIGSRSHAGERLLCWLNQLGAPYVFTPAGSSLKFCRVAEGLADVYPRFGPTSQWDTAAAQCILEAAGGYVWDTAGQVVQYGLHRPLLNPDFVAAGPSFNFEIIRKRG